MSLEKRGLFADLVVVILLSSIITSASAQNVVPVDKNLNDKVPHQGVLVSPDDHTPHLYSFLVSLTPKPPVSCTYDKTEESRLNSDFQAAGWTFNNSTGELPGSYDIVRCDAGKAEHNPPTVTDNWVYPILHFFEVDYNNSGTPPVIPAGGNLTWIQFIYTNYPKNPTLPQPYVDPQPNDDDLPFYFSRSEMTNNNYGGLKIYNRGIWGDKVNMTFYDAPTRDWDGIVQGHHNPMTWKAHLYAAVWNSTKIITVIYKGVEWGFQITYTDQGPAVPSGTVHWNSGGIAGDKDWIFGPDLNGTTASGVGGIVIPVDKFGLLAPYIGLASTTMIGAVATVVYVKRVKRRKEKQ